MSAVPKDVVCNAVKGFLDIQLVSASTGTFDFSLVGVGEYHGGTIKLLFQPPGDDTHQTLSELFIVKDDNRGEVIGVNHLFSELILLLSSFLSLFIESL